MATLPELIQKADDELGELLDLEPLEEDEEPIVDFGGPITTSFVNNNSFLVMTGH